MIKKLLKARWVALNGGFTLVELLIGSFLGLMMIGGIVQVYVSSSEVDRNRHSMSAISENARFALEHMRRQLRNTCLGVSVGVCLDFDSANQKLIFTIEEEGAAEDFFYQFDDVNSTILFDGDGDGDADVLVDGILGWDLDVGIGARDSSTLSNSTIRFYDIDDSTIDLNDAWVLRVTLELEDPSRPSNKLQLADGEISTTIGLRNLLLVNLNESTSTTSNTSTTSSSTTSFSTTSSSTTSSSSTTTETSTSTTASSTTSTTTTTTTPPLCATTVSGSRQNKNATVSVASPSGTCTYPNNDSYSCTVNAASGSTITIQQVSGGTTQKTATANCGNRTVNF